MQSFTKALKISRAKGAYLFTDDGQKYFDGISSWWLVTHGHGQQEIVEAISKQASQVSQVVFANFEHNAAEELVDLIGQLLPQNLRHIFFSDNGSTSVEVAMKMAYQYSYQSNQPERCKFIAFECSYHGDTCGAMSVNGQSAFTKPYQKLRFEVLRAKHGKSVHDPIEAWTSDFADLMRMYGHEVCAVLIEPLIQGAGGMIVWPVEAVQRICDIAAGYGTLIIFDEVMTGFGRTGSMFAFEQVGRVPDLICLSKGLTGGFLPMGLTIASERIYGAFLDEDPSKMFFHGHSFTGNALSCAAACANLRLLRNPIVQSQISAIEIAHRKSLSRISSDELIKEYRVCGTVGVLELSQTDKYAGNLSKQLHSHLLSQGIFIRPLGSVVYLMPPFCTLENEVENAWDQISDAIYSIHQQNTPT